MGPGYTLYVCIRYIYVIYRTKMLITLKSRAFQFSRFSSKYNRPDFPFSVVFTVQPSIPQTPLSVSYLHESQGRVHTQYRYHGQRQTNKKNCWSYSFYLIAEFTFADSSWRLKSYMYIPPSWASKSGHYKTHWSFQAGRKLWARLVKVSRLTLLLEGMFNHARLLLQCDGGML